MKTITYDTPTSSFMHSAMETSVSALTKVKFGFDTVIRSLQVSRMIQAMNTMSDKQLATIGITRSEIPAHAFKLMMQDHDKR